jgi:hypothetical protein
MPVRGIVWGEIGRFKAASYLLYGVKPGKSSRFPRGDGEKGLEDSDLPDEKNL